MESNQDIEQLRLLSIFHYVVAGLLALFSMFPILHVVMGIAMVGYQNVEPVFVLPRGGHEFKFTSDGFKTTAVKMMSLGAGSKQFLVVKMDPGTSDPGKKPDGKSSPAADAKRQ